MNPNRLNWLNRRCLTPIYLAALVSAGCRGSELPTAPVRGTVTIDGKPLAMARIVLTPEKGGRSATGQTASDGTFALSSYGNGDGAVVGRHLATVAAREGGAENSAAAPGLTRPGPSLIPEAYNNTATSGLDFEVVADRENVFEIKLSSKKN